MLLMGFESETKNYNIKQTNKQTDYLDVSGNSITGTVPISFQKFAMIGKSFLPPGCSCPPRPPIVLYVIKKSFPNLSFVKMFLSFFRIQ